MADELDKLFDDHEAALARRDQKRAEEREASVAGREEWERRREELIPTLQALAESARRRGHDVVAGKIEDGKALGFQIKFKDYASRSFQAVFRFAEPRPGDCMVEVRLIDDDKDEFDGRAQAISALTPDRLTEWISKLISHGSKKVTG